MESITISPQIQAAEKDLQKCFYQDSRVEEEHLRQKSRSMWLESGDKNTSYLHKQAKARKNYKVVTKIIAHRFKNILSNHISEEQFGFLEGRQIHEAIGVAQEGMHSMKTKTLKGFILKINISKAYDKVSWLYIRIILTSWFIYRFYQMGYELYHNIFLFDSVQWGSISLLSC